MRHSPIPPRPQLLTYPDSMGGDLQALGTLLDGPLEGLFRGVHILPPFPSSGDRGFAPLTYGNIDPRFGSWADVEHIARRHDVLLDVMINHISRQSPEFHDFQRHGRRSQSADLFITLDKVWPSGEPPDEDVARMFLRKPQRPFSTITIEETGEQEQVWTSFGTADWSEQIDLDVTSMATRSLFSGWLRTFADHGVRIIRLDAVGYVIKKAGTSCFMVEPEIYEFLDWVVGLADSLGLVVLPEIHDHYATHEKLARRGYWTYDFVLPALLLDAIETGKSERLAVHLGSSPERQFTMLDCHDGIPIRPDLDGILTPREMGSLADLIQERGGNVNRILSDVGADDSVDVHQLNCTYYSAVGGDDSRYVLARAIQLFARGVPQIYYVGLLAGSNDDSAVARTGEGRDINRRDYSLADVWASLDLPVVRRTIDLIRLRNQHPAFRGSLHVSAPTPSTLVLAWRDGGSSCELYADLVAGDITVSASEHLEVPGPSNSASAPVPLEGLGPASG